MNTIIEEYQKNKHFIRDWVQLPTPQERKRWELKQKIIVTPFLKKEKQNGN